IGAGRLRDVVEEIDDLRRAVRIHELLSCAGTVAALGCMVVDDGLRGASRPRICVVSRQTGCCRGDCIGEAPEATSTVRLARKEVGAPCMPLCSPHRGEVLLPAIPTGRLAAEVAPDWPSATKPACACSYPGRVLGRAGGLRGGGAPPPGATSVASS